LLNLLIARVDEIARPPRRVLRHPQNRIRSNLRRAIIGVRVRQALHARTLGGRITCLLNLLRDFEAHALRIATRLARGLTRLRPILAAPVGAEILALGSAAARQYEDTS